MHGTRPFFSHRCTPYARYRPRSGLEFWGVAGYGYGSMTLNPADKYPASQDPANPDIWLTMFGVGGRSTMLSADASGGPVLDVAADALLTPHGCRCRRVTAGSRIGIRHPPAPGSGRCLGACRWPMVPHSHPTLAAALRYDAGDGETRPWLELGTGLTL